MELQKIGCIAMTSCGSFHGKKQFLGIECAKGRGIIMPGGKWEKGETYTETASRELREETGLVVDPKELRYVWMGPDGDGYIVLAFEFGFSCIEDQEPQETPEGNPIWAEKEVFLQSKYAGYYECLFQVIDKNW